VRRLTQNTEGGLYTADEVLGLLANGLDSEELGVLSDRPVIAVSLNGSSSEADLAQIAERLPCVFIGVAQEMATDRVTAEFDVMLSREASPPRPWVGFAGGPEPALHELVGMIERNPMAAVTIAQVLRIGASLSDDAALTVESLAYGLLQSGPEHAHWLEGRGRSTRPRIPGSALLVERNQATMTITFNRPQLRNIYDDEMRDALIEALRAVAADPSIEYVSLRGAGPAFCSGGDLRSFGTLPDPATAHLVRATRSADRWLIASSPRLTAYLHGFCIGAGIELGAFASRIVAASDTKIRLPEMSMGLMPGAGGTVSLSRRIGRARTAYLALSGVVIDVSTALQWGLVDIVEDARVDPST
jgi:enoyl-CoA hydratase/carnithine racemase